MPATAAAKGECNKGAVRAPQDQLMDRNCSRTHPKNLWGLKRISESALVAFALHTGMILNRSTVVHEHPL